MAVAAVIGGAGRMGSWLASFLNKNGYRVIVTDRNKLAARRLARASGFSYVNDLATATRMAQLVVMATPTFVTHRLLQRLNRNISKDKLFIEISSVKQPLRSVVRKLERRGVSVLSIHPLFGPGAQSIRGRTILVVPLARRMPLADSFLRTLRRKGAKLVECDFSEHDKLISVVLALPHFLNATFVNALKSLRVDLKVLSEIAGPTFKLQLLVAEEIHQENLDNEVSLLMDSSHSTTALKKSASASNGMMNMIARRKRREVLRTLQLGRSYLQRDSLFASAYSRFNEAVSASSPA